MIKKRTGNVKDHTGWQKYIDLQSHPDIKKLIPDT